MFSFVEYFPKKLLRFEPINMHTLLSNTIGGGTYWFTSALVVAEIVVLLLLLTRNRNVWFYALSCLVVASIGWYLIQIDFHLFGFGRDPWAYRRGLLAVAFMAAGGLFWKYETFFDSHRKILLPLFALLYALVFSFGNSWIKVLISTMDINALGFVASLIGCILLVYVCKLLNPSKFLTFVGQYSLCFYFLSGALPMIVTLIFRRVIPGENLLGLSCVFVFCVAIAYLITYLLNRYIPFVFDLRKLKK